MDCRETQPLLGPFHDGEVAAAERARIEEHLRGCPECAALLAGLARVDRAAGVPDPGPAYWDRFNARVTDRVAREPDGPKAAVLRPKGGWVRQQFRYLAPAVAAAALVVVIVQYGGMRPGAPAPTVPSPAAVPPAVSEPASPDPARERTAVADPGPRAAKKAESAAVARPVPPPAPAGERFAAVTREERERDAAPAAMSVPSPPPPMMFRGTPAVSPPLPASDGIPRGLQAERKKAVGAGMAKDSSAPSPAAPPCELSRALAERERFRDAEAAQRACLAGDLDPPSREKELVFLAELLDRQERFAEADTIIAEVRRRFPESVPLDRYLLRRPTVQTRGQGK